MDGMINVVDTRCSRFTGRRLSGCAEPTALFRHVESEFLEVPEE
jgi:hypothetical protein